VIAPATDSLLSVALDGDLERAVEENLFALFRSMATALNGEMMEDSFVSHHFSSPFNPMFQGVWRVRASDEDFDELFDRTLEWFQTRGAPMMCWWTAPSTTPIDIGERLIARGLFALDQHTATTEAGERRPIAGDQGMAIDLDEVDATASASVFATLPAGFTIEEVRDDRALADFERTFAAGFKMSKRVAHGWTEAAVRLGVGQTPWAMYLGRINGEPVATSIVSLGAGVAGVYGVSSIPAVRGNGVGGAITLAPLLEARALGYRYAVLTASPMACRAYERIGFRACDTRLSRYLWRNVG
jgi:GNAT superfamily N-acetyltransferase